MHSAMLSNRLPSEKAGITLGLLGVQHENNSEGPLITDREQGTDDTSQRRFSWHISTHWLSACLALILLTVTAVYASHSNFLAGYRVIGRSPGNVLLLLRVLSELAGLMLAVTIAGAFEKIQWLLISRDGDTRGIAFTDYLSLQPGTGVLGLFRLALSLRVPKFSSRVWSIIKLASMIIVPLLNVVIMSNVSSTITFDKLNTTAPTYGYGVGTFNASLASVWHPMADLLFSTSFMFFLSDGTRVVDTTSSAAREQCRRSDQGRGECKLSYYVAGGVDDFAPALLASGYAQADAFIAQDQQGYVFEYEDGNKDWQYEADKQCTIFGAGIAAWALCLKNGKHDNEIQAKLMDCPANVASSFQCQNATYWLHNNQPGFSTSLRTWYRRATVAYSRINSSILTHTFHDHNPKSPAPISAAELLQAFSLVFKASNTASPFASALAVLGVGNNTASAPLYAWWYFHGVSRLANDDAAARRRGISGLQSMLGIPIYHCQVKGLAQIRDLGFDNTTSVGQAILASFPTNEAQTPIFPAVLRYVLVTAPATLIAYVVLGGVTLFCCFVALVAGTFLEPVRGVRAPGSFPVVDFVTRCQVVRVGETGDGSEVVGAEEFGRLGTEEREGRLIERVKGMRVVFMKDGGGGGM